MNDEQRTKLETNVAEWLKDHVYTELTNANGVELWRCQKPGSHNLAFDICVTRYGTAVFGDIGHLTFDIDASYGIHYLANTGLHNLHGKLAASCKEEWIDLDAILDTLRDCIYEVLDDEEVVYPEGLSVQSLIGWLEAKDEEELGPDLPFSQWVELLASVGGFDDRSGRDIVPAFDLLAESEELLRTSDLWESTISKPSDHVWRKLVYVQHAAGAIMAQKAAKEAAQAPEYCYAMGPKDDLWSDDGLAAFVSDRELPMGTVIQRAVVSRRSASSFLPDASEVIEHMGNAADDDNSEFADGFPNETKEQEVELERLLKPLKSWADRTFDVNFYTVAGDSTESYVVTTEDVAAGEAYRKTLEVGVVQ
ncbi:hypothetical protein WG29040_23255 [Pseudomonas sp. PAMC 29040]|uniref:hypothetical protein n=1 Tax=Pseudomonas sp. PAMC 29040 TaxID=2498450 RepID=UPI000FA606D9|nr:hypothetical protein [Pseudomonas sp. PAMC 29040]RUT30859.1 hypothetical protein WG29040_23255 [Pseudomonas sp. PAMC 29040]